MSYTRLTKAAAIVASVAVSVSVAATASARETDATDGQVGVQVVGGREVPEGTYPWLAYLDIQMESKRWSCGGSVISSDIILTAAHCVKASSFENSGNFRSLTAYVGHSRYADAKAAGDTRTSSRMVMGKGISYGDWAVVKLDSPIKRDSYPAINASTRRNSGPTFTGVGWGFTTNRGRGSDVLRSVQLPFVQDSSCSMSSKNEICAGDYGVGTCNGDSGGPLLNDGVITGLVSWGIGCGSVRDEYGHYAKVSTYANDIQDAIKRLGGQPARVSR